MSKTKAASRLLSSLLAILMVFCLFPKEAVSAEDEEFEISVTTSYRMNLNNDNGPVAAYIGNQLLEKNPPITPILFQKKRNIWTKRMKSVVILRIRPITEILKTFSLS